MLPWTLQIVTVPVVLLYENLFEWLTHKYILHGLGRKRESFWSFHWIDHHSNVRKNGFLDLDYKTPLLTWNAQSKEILALAIAGLVHGPLVYYSPISYLTLVYCGIRYYYVHRKSHLNPEWAKAKLPWHYDHHMAPNQNLNWCVTRPWFDWLLRTRFVYFNKEIPNRQRYLLD
ncbi:MAG: sterol desaturase family protein [Oligoflexia bacterium]|nr:sterol desaturase family protein [Oligoflexia bacterium]